MNFKDYTPEEQINQLRIVMWNVLRELQVLYRMSPSGTVPLGINKMMDSILNDDERMP